MHVWVVYACQGVRAQRRQVEYVHCVATYGEEDTQVTQHWGLLPLREEGTGDEGLEGMATQSLTKRRSFVSSLVTSQPPLPHQNNTDPLPRHALVTAALPQGLNTPLGR